MYTIKNPFSWDSSAKNITAPVTTVNIKDEDGNAEYVELKSDIEVGTINIYNFLGQMRQRQPLLAYIV